MSVFLLITAPPHLDAQIRSIRFQRLTVEDGLSQSTINDFLQDRTGFLWIATQDGLNRYDGYGFEVFESDPADPASLPGDWIEALAEDASGDLWIATEGAGLARWRRATNSFARWSHDPRDPASLSGDRVVSIHIDRQGSIWLGTAMGDQAQPRVELGARREDARQVFYVRDNGMGIEPEDHEKIFEPFQRLGAHVDGTGIGLALVQRIVELHGGRVWVESDGPGQGSTFCFTLGGHRPPASGRPA